MRIMCIFYRCGQELVGGAEIHFYKLAQTLASLGHQVDIYTTRSVGLGHSRYGNTVWDNQFSPLPEQVDGMNIYRFRVKNPSPGTARKCIKEISKRFQQELASPDFAAGVASAIESGRGYLLGGWNELEQWGNPGQAIRWTERCGIFALNGEGVQEISVLLYAGDKTKGRLEIVGQGSQDFSLASGEERRVQLGGPASGPLVCRLRVNRLLRTGTDPRRLGVAVKQINFADAAGVHDIPLSDDYEAFLAREPEGRIAKVLWDNALQRPYRFSKYQRCVVGPDSRQLERAVAKAASGYDVILANMIPMQTFSVAARTAKRARKPLLLFPLYHPRDPHHYWRHFHDDMRRAGLVDSNSAAIEEIIRGRGFHTACIGPGFDPVEFDGDSISGRRFREKHGLEEEKLLLFVGRKVSSKRYDLAADAVRELRRRGWPARLVMIGPDEDKVPLLGEHILYMGRVERRELLDAYDACDVFILPSIAESFGMVFCEAWLRRKPVLGNRDCTAIASLISEGQDGYLASTAGEFADRAEQILRSPEMGVVMGERGRAKVLGEYTWDAIGRKCEAHLQGLLRG